MTIQSRNQILLFTLIALVALTTAYYWLTQNDRSFVDGRTFRVEDLKTIDRVDFESRNHTVQLQYDGVRWNVNGELADRNLVDVLFATLQQVRPVRPVAAVLQDSIGSALKADGTKVTLFSGQQPELTFLAGGNLRKTQAYFQKQAEDIVYIMSIPGYRVYASGIFELDALGWKDKHVFQFNWRNFQSLRVKFSGEAGQNFDVRFLKSYFSIEGMNEVDTTRLNNFLDAVSLLTVSEYVNDEEKLDSLNSATPYMTIVARDIAEKEYHFSLYVNERVPANVAGIINGSALANFNRNSVAEVMRKRNFFNAKK